MTNEDKKLIVKYMGWKLPCEGNIYHAAICAIDDDSFCIACEFHHPFDLNDAELVVQEMQKRGEWMNFRSWAGTLWLKSKDSAEDVTAWLMTMEEDRQVKNFFKAFVEWRKKNER